MERIAGPGATTDNLFTEGDPSLGIDATTVTANWLNGVQEELIHILEEAGITPDGATLTQVLEALRMLFVQKDVPEPVSVLNTLEILAFTGSSPANGIFSWFTSHVTDSTLGGVGAGDNTCILGFNAYLKNGVWTRRHGGITIGIEVVPGSRSIRLLDGGSGSPEDSITWVVSSTRFIVDGSASRIYTSTVYTDTIAPVVADTPWVTASGNLTVSAESRKYPTESMQIRGFISNIGGISAGATAATISGNPFGLTDGLSVSFFGYNGTAPELWRVQWTAAWGETRLYPVGAVSSGSTSRFMVVVPCTGISE